MTGRFSHLDFDDAPEPARPKPARKPPPLMGPTWSDADRQRAARELYQQQPSRYELNVGRGTFTWVDPPEPLWLMMEASRAPRFPATSSRIEYDVWRSELVDPFAQFGEFVVRLGVRPAAPLSEVWEYQQVRCNQEVLMALPGEVPVMRRMFAPRRSIVVALDPRAKTTNCVRTYVEIGAA